VTGREGEAAVEERLTKVLGRAPYAEDRAVRTVHQVWEAGGFPVSGAAVKCVSRFEGLSFRYARRTVQGGEHVCEFNAVRAARLMSADKSRTYEVRVGERLTPVGTAASSHVVLMVAESGRVYGAYDAFLARYGETVDAAILNLHHGVSPVRVTERA
jgi:hypothetical protein